MKPSAVLLLATLIYETWAIYRPVREYAGSTFFDRWTYYNFYDNTTWGNVTFVDVQTAARKRLTYVNDRGNAIIQVDNVTTVENATLVFRDSVRLTSVDTYPIGSLLLLDAVHIPYGCSVWPSWWMYGQQEEWPLAGEIDIIESVNQLPRNQIALHTKPGCVQVQTPNMQTGLTIEGDCNNDRGCLVQETKPNSFGAGFAAAGGGVFALQMAESGIYSWFWSRPDIPENVNTATAFNPIDTSNWGIPTATYQASGCNASLTEFFPPQSMVLLTTLCGAWAGVPSVYADTCTPRSPVNACFNDNILGNGSNYRNAYWEIRYIRTYLSDDAPPIPRPTPPATRSTTGNSGPSISIPNPSDPPLGLPSDGAALSNIESPRTLLILGYVSALLVMLLSFTIL